MKSCLVLSTMLYVVSNSFSGLAQEISTLTLPGFGLNPVPTSGAGTATAIGTADDGSETTYLYSEVDVFTATLNLDSETVTTTVTFSPEGTLVASASGFRLVIGVPSDVGSGALSTAAVEQLISPQGKINCTYIDETSGQCIVEGFAATNPPLDFGGTLTTAVTTTMTGSVRTGFLQVEVPATSTFPAIVATQSSDANNGDRSNMSVHSQLILVTVGVVLKLLI
ncbi:hypothetical protein VKT23_010529 [Stygiomarasmius scandens]|uniref:Uncharacterized protein n=1 Tax=Marasmiellus scandens TaxID=2682957 RepID=A0ABR1JCI5_9AGAR